MSSCSSLNDSFFGPADLLSMLLLLRSLMLLLSSLMLFFASNGIATFALASRSAGSESCELIWPKVWSRLSLCGLLNSRFSDSPAERGYVTSCSNKSSSSGSAAGVCAYSIYSLRLECPCISCSGLLVAKSEAALSLATTRCEADACKLLPLWKRDH